MLTSSILPSTGGQGAELRSLDQYSGRINSVFLVNQKDTVIEHLLPIGFV